MLFSNREEANIVRTVKYIRSKVNATFKKKVESETQNKRYSMDEDKITRQSTDTRLNIPTLSLGVNKSKPEAGIPARYLILNGDLIISP